MKALKIAIVRTHLVERIAPLLAAATASSTLLSNNVMTAISAQVTVALLHVYPNAQHHLPHFLQQRSNFL